MKLKLIYTLAEFNALEFDTTKPVFCDTETAGLYGEVRLIQFYQSHWELPVVVDLQMWTLNEVARLKHLIQYLHLVFHNSSYDLYCLNINPEKFDDTMYLARIKFPHLAVEEDAEAKGFGLDKLVYSLGYSYLYKDLDKKKMQKSDYSMERALDLEQYEYAATDVIALAKIWPQLQDATSNTSYIVDIMSTRYANQYCRNGISVDTSMVHARLIETIKAIDSNEQLLGGLNVNSPKQCREALGSDGTDKSTLLRLIADGNETAKLIFEQRRLLKKKTMLESYNYNKVYSVFKVAGAATGRFTATGKGIKCGINSQQIPRAQKDLFYNPNPGMVTIEADYSTLELRLAAAIFGDENMAQRLREGADLHTELAAVLAGKSLEEVSKEDRTRAKAANFGFVYGMSASTFKDYAFDNYGLVLDDNQATEWRNKYFGMYPKIAMYHQNVWKNYKNRDFVQRTALGKPVKPKLGTDAINAPVQGTGAECTKLAIHYMVKRNSDYLGYIVNVVHDSIKLEVPFNLMGQAKKDVEECMLEAWDAVMASKNKDPNSVILINDIPMKVDVEIRTVTNA